MRDARHLASRLVSTVCTTDIGTTVGTEKEELAFSYSVVMQCLSRSYVGSSVCVYISVNTYHVAVHARITD